MSGDRTLRRRLFAGALQRTPEFIFQAGTAGGGSAAPSAVSPECAKEAELGEPASSGSKRVKVAPAPTVTSYTYSVTSSCPDEFTTWTFKRSPLPPFLPPAAGPEGDADEDADGNVQSSYLGCSFTGETLDQKWIGDGLFAVLTAGGLAHGNYAREEGWNQLVLSVHDIRDTPTDEDWEDEDPEGNIDPSDSAFEIDEAGLVADYTWDLAVPDADADADDNYLRARIIGIDSSLNAVVSVTYYCPQKKDGMVLSPKEYDGRHRHQLMVIARDSTIVSADLWSEHTKLATVDAQQQTDPAQAYLVIDPAQHGSDSEEEGEESNDDQEFGLLEPFLHGELSSDGRLFVFFAGGQSVSSFESAGHRSVRNLECAAPTPVSADRHGFVLVPAKKDA